MNRVCYAGIDVSRRTLDVATRDTAGKTTHTAQFENTAKGHAQLIQWLCKRGRQARVVIEATGVYSFDLALALHSARRVELMVANPRAARRFADACRQRTSTDSTMALSLLEFAARMEFVPWKPPPLAVRQLREIARRSHALTQDKTSELNRLHAAETCKETSTVVRDDLAAHIAHLEQRIAELERHALALIKASPEIYQAFTHLISIRGFATTSAIQLLAEILTLPADMTARQWVAHCGLDVRLVTSGTSVQKQPRISRHGNAHIRRILYMPALVAIQHEANVRLFYQQLLARGKSKRQAIVAVMRKLLLSIYGMLKSNTDFVGSKFRALPQAA